MKNDLTVKELLEAIKQQWDMYYLLEVLDLEFDTLVNLLEDAIVEKYDTILEELE